MAIPLLFGPAVDAVLGPVILGALAVAATVFGAILSGRVGALQAARQRRAQGEADQASRQVAQQVGADPDLTELITERLDAQEAAAAQLRERLRRVEGKFPDASEFQKYADSNQLFLAYQIGELTKRLELIERGQITRFQVVGIVITTLVAAVAVASGVVVLLQAVHLLH